MNEQFERFFFLYYSLKKTEMHLHWDAFEIQIQRWPEPHSEPQFITSHFKEVLTVSVSSHH